jgi:POT family proton-dependent oligopeptide transporter
MHDVEDSAVRLLSDDDELETENESLNLRKVADSLPLSVWMVTVVEMCERFAFYGVSGPLQNYLQYPRGDSLRPGGLGLGQGRATTVNQCFSLYV